MNTIKFLLALPILMILVSCGGSESSGTVEDEFSATVSVSSPSSVSEDEGSATFTISLSAQNTSGSSLTIPFSFSGTATEDSDFSSNENSVIIDSNETSATVEVSITDDEEVEDDETIILSLGSLPSELAAGSNTSSTITITDNDEEEEPIEVDIEVTFGAATGSAITIESWSDVSADEYVIIINAENTFADLTSESFINPSTTYLAGYGEQIVYAGSDINAVTVTLLDFSTPYFVKVYPLFSDGYNNSIEAATRSTTSCETSSTTESQVCFEVDEVEETRTITSNQYPDHPTGNFPNYEGESGEEFLPTQITRVLDLTPTYTGTPIYVYDETGGPTPSNQNFWQFGMATNGVEFHPMGLKPWENPDTGEQNWEWQAKVTEEGETDLDEYGAHVTSQGLYHYHGDIVGLADDENGNNHSLIYGFAADGFPIYYKYGYSDPDDPESAIVELLSSYRLKAGMRSGTGTAGEDYPDGVHDGTYIQDFEFVENLGDLDECNGRTGVTPEFPDGTYYYVITSDFPVTPNCFFGTPDDDWIIGK